MKRIISAFLAVLISANMSAVVTSATHMPYNDIAEDVWYGKAAEFCYLNSFMTGTSDDVFAPAGSMTRAQIAVILAKLGKADLTQYTSSSFADVPDGTWYTAPTAWMKSKDIASGTGKDMFTPGGVLTREQFALLLKKFAEVSGINTSSRADLSVYLDIAEAHDWAKDALAWAVSAHVISGVGGGETPLLSPLGAVTRAQTAVMIKAFTLDTLYGDHVHDWEGPSCTMASLCRECGIFAEFMLGHDASGVTCTEGCECPRCSTYLPATGHAPTQATCAEPSVCTVCGEELESALGHTTEYGICERCGADVFPNELERVKFHMKNGAITPENPYKLTTEAGAAFTMCFDGAKNAVVMNLSYTDETGAIVALDLSLEDMEKNPEFACVWKNVYGTVATGSGNIDKAAYVNALTVPDFAFTGSSSLIKGQFTSIVGYYLYDALKTADGLFKTYLKSEIVSLGFENIKF